jgi:hypothetical protein
MFEAIFSVEWSITFVALDSSRVFVWFYEENFHQVALVAEGIHHILKFFFRKRRISNDQVCLTKEICNSIKLLRSLFHFTIFYRRIRRHLFLLLLYSPTWRWFDFLVGGVSTILFSRFNFIFVEWFLDEGCWICGLLWHDSRLKFFPVVKSCDQEGIIFNLRVYIAINNKTFALGIVDIWSWLWSLLWLDFSYLLLFVIFIDGLNLWAFFNFINQRRTHGLFGLIFLFLCLLLWDLDILRVGNSLPNFLKSC